MSIADKILASAKKNSDGRFNYVGEGGREISCSPFTRLVLYESGIISKEECDNPYSMWAGQGIPGFLDDESRFRKKTWAPENLKPGNILYSNWYHVAIWDGINGLYEACPKSHGLASNGKSAVGHFPSHGYYNCGTGTFSWTCIYEAIEPEETKYTSDQIEKAIAEAYRIANDNSIGYSNQVGSNLGPYSYDCGGFLSRSLYVAGILPSGVVFEPNSPNNPWGYDTILTKYGFKKLTYNAATVKRGDVLIRDGRHTEMALGNGKQIGARNDYDNRPGDSSGGEISETALYTNYWDYMYRLQVNDDPEPTPSRHPVLQLGSKGSEVITLQKLLNDKITAGLLLDGSFGQLTLAAVKKFQAANNLVVDGMVGPLTWAELDKNNPEEVLGVKEWQTVAKADGLYSGDIDGKFGPLSKKAAAYGVYVGSGRFNLTKFWQKWLRSKGYYAGIIDGDYGAMTRAAVIKAQKVYGLSQDGAIGTESTPAFLGVK